MSQVCRKVLGVRFPHIFRMPKFMKTDKPPGPIQVCLFRFIGILLYADLIAQGLYELRHGCLAPVWSSLLMFVNATKVCIDYTSTSQRGKLNSIRESYRLKLTFSFKALGSDGRL